MQREQWMWSLRLGAEASFRETIEWGREVIKHVVILNGAGLAATASAIAANVIPAGEFGTISRVTGFYVAGLICAFLNMIWRWPISATEDERQMIYIHAFALDHKPIEQSHEPFINRIYVRGVTYILLMMGFGSFISGSVFLVETLRGSPDASMPDTSRAIAYRFVLPGGSQEIGEYPGILRPLIVETSSKK
ncbi:hypothetical protein [Paraburkholderia phenoliruptrix]|uniref:hypothetical protein n=1 Tax=Paraburkholderia phenoliruptrix TaxID=252970 RepID=UPI001C6E146B|nr:hypothetical protein [Paraburkholderia phenoliruptrix]MBW9106100.1 hypothetical protein [Paraburkholderia phenoliruptrix]MBW9130966.1 hypothetical protein [Paraburkholderia ginsengiterrae]